MIKKILIGGGIAVVVLVVLVVLGISFFLDSAIKKGVETVGPMVAKVETKLDSVSLSLLSGSGKINGLVIGNPEGFKTPTAIRVGSVSLALQPKSLLSDKIIIKSVNVQAPEITYETDFKTSNLNKIMANVEATTGTGKDSTKPAEPAPGSAKPSKKLQVDEFVISGGKVSVSATMLGGQAVTVPLPEIRLKDLGQGPEGITATELTRVVLGAIEKAAAGAASGAVGDLGKAASGLTKDAGKAVSGSAEKVTKGIGDLFKKKN